MKQNLSVGLFIFLLAAFGLLGVMAAGVVIDTAACAFILFLFNAAFHWCGGWMYMGLWKTLSYGFLMALVVRAVKLAQWVVKA
jgi:hypothetical protein